MRRGACEGPRSAPADPGRCCDGARYNPLLDRARRIAAAQDLDALNDQLCALELAWIHAQVSDDDRLTLLELHHRRHRELAEREVMMRVDLPLPQQGRSTEGALCQKGDPRAQPQDTAARRR